MRTPIYLACFLALNGPSSTAQMRMGGQQEPIYTISTPLEFKGRVVAGDLRTSEIPALLDLPVRNGNSDVKESYGVEMTGTNGQKFTASTCREWKKANQEGAYAATTYDMAMETALIHTCGLLFQLQSAKTPRKTFIANPKVTLADLKLLPAEMLVIDSDAEDQERERLRGRTVAEIVPTHDIQETNEHVLRLTFGGFRQFFWEAARADFDGDGFEEIFVFTGGRVVDGTMGYADHLVLTRTAPSGPLKLVSNKNKSAAQAK